MPDHNVPQTLYLFYWILLNNSFIFTLAICFCCIVCVIFLVVIILCTIYLTRTCYSLVRAKWEFYRHLPNENACSEENKEAIEEAKDVLRNSLPEVKHVSIRKWMGTGASGARVFKAKWDGEDVAVKMFSANRLSLANRHIDLFEQELGIMRGLEHPHVVSLLGCYLRDDEQLGIVMEFCSGGSLRDFVESGKAAAAPKRTILDMARQICEGMHYLHSKKLIHRDLKPDNVLLQDSKTVKIADFGLARYLDRSTENTRLTMGVGTSYYVSPEVMKRHYYTDKCDVYSFGMMLFELFSGKLDPFRSSGMAHGRTDWQVQMRAAKESTYRPDISMIQRSRFSEFTELIQQCWDADETQRPSFEDMIFRFGRACLLSRNPVEVVVER